MTWWEEFEGIPTQSSERDSIGSPVEVSCNPRTLIPEENCTACGKDAKQDGSDIEDWHAFTEESNSFSTVRYAEMHSPSSDVVQRTLQSCFQLKDKDYTDVKTAACIFCQHRLLHRPLRSPRAALGQLIQLKFNQVILSQAKESSKEQKSPTHNHHGHLDLPLECRGFDWNVDDTASFVDISPMTFRPTQPESPIGVEFDQEKALLGLATLGELELRNMIAEMENKFASMSEVLVCDLIDRDKFIFGLNIKNKFISALLQVQVLRHSNSQSGGSRLESVSRAWAVKSRQSEERMNIRFLSLVIPYHTPKGSIWSTSSLQSLTRILSGIAEGNASVPSLLADYIQSEVLQDID